MNQLNASLRTVFQDLVERRLWPVALVLAIALVAIPVVLSSPASDTAGTPTTPVAPVVPATGSGSSLSAFQPVVNTEGSKSTEIRKSLKGFSSKDPFKVHNLPTAASAELSAAAGATAGVTAGDTGTTTTTGSGTTTTESGSGSGSTGSGTSGSGTSTGQSSAPKYYTWTATVRFGIGENPDKKRLERFRALPNSENPVVVFMGVTTDGKSAVFLVSAATGTTGEGDCEPDDTCTFLYMEPGQTQTFEAVDANDAVVTYTLKLIDNKVEETEAPKSSSSDGKASSRAQRRARRAQRIARDRRDDGFAARIEAVGF